MRAVGTGSDAGSAWLLAVVALCCATVAAAVIARLGALRGDAAPADGAGRTPLGRHATAGGGAMTAFEPRLMAGPGRRTVTLEQHLGLHGLTALGSGAGVDALADAVEQAGLRRRGGAGFPTATKLRALAGGRRAPLVVANSSEGEPASGKDRTLLTRSPQLVLDGLQLAALALGAEQAVVAVRETARGARAALAAALAERAAAGRDRVPVELFPVPYGFVAGEERAVLNALAGGPAPWRRCAARGRARGRRSCRTSRRSPIWR